jgi:hypothetical protein
MRFAKLAAQPQKALSPIVSSWRELKSISLMEAFKTRVCLSP